MSWVLLCTAYQPQHLIIKGLLESAGIPVDLKYEAVSPIQGINRGPLGEVKILVPKEHESLAREIMEAPAINDDDRP